MFLNTLVRLTTKTVFQKISPDKTRQKHDGEMDLLPFVARISAYHDVSYFEFVDFSSTSDKWKKTSVKQEKQGTRMYLQIILFYMITYTYIVL